MSCKLGTWWPQCWKMNFRHGEWPGELICQKRTFCSKSIQNGFLKPSLRTNNTDHIHMYIPPDADYLYSTIPTLSSPQTCRYPLVERTNVTLEFCYFKAEGSLNIFQSDGLIFRLHISDHRGERTRRSQYSWTRSNISKAKAKLPIRVRETKRSYLSLERQRAKQLLWPLSN